MQDGTAVGSDLRTDRREQGACLKSLPPLELPPRRSGSYQSRTRAKMPTAFSASAELEEHGFSSFLNLGWVVDDLFFRHLYSMFHDVE